MKNTTNTSTQTAGAHRISQLEDALKNSWTWVQKKMYCYELPEPQISDLGPGATAAINMSSHKTSVNSQFIDYLESKGVELESALRGVLAHEAGHFKIMPWDAKTLIKVQNEISKTCEEGRQSITNYFLDVSLNIDLLLSRGIEEIRQVYTALDKKHDLDNLLCKVYEQKTGQPFGTRKINPEHADILMKLCSIQYTDKKKIYSNARKFARIIWPLVKEKLDREDQMSKDEKQQEKEEFTPENLGGKGLGQFGEREIRKAMKELARESSGPRAYQKLREQADQANPKNSSSQGNGTPTSQEHLIEFYKAKAEGYEMTIEDRPDTSSGFQDRIKEWNTDDPTGQIDIFNSYGRIMPEITKMRAEDKQDLAGNIAGLPNLLILLDTSGSMGNPEAFTSPSVLGSLIAARHYLNRGSEVGLINFSDTAKTTYYTKEEDIILKALFYTQMSGNSAKWAATLRKSLSRSKKPVDALLITDGMIDDLGEILNTLNGWSERNRVTILDVKSIGIMAGYLGEKTRIKIYNVDNMDDIPKVIIKDIQAA